ncbi:MAG: 3-keto-5-aminohexanoate cleavage protein, partial [Anaerolineaceae bacterium]|nr:3-keto-5-aminohexanoate cleavage protein [Anaerolineaceae bacterium]
MMKPEDYMWDYSNSYEYVNRVARSAMPPLIITAAITGGVQGKEANINLPEEPEEQADQTYDAYKAGASMVHIHARDPEKLYNATGDPQVFGKINKLIRERCPDIIINASTGGGLGMTDEEKMACLDAGPEVASLNLAPEIFKFKFRAREAPIKHPKPAEVADGVVHVTFDSIAMYAQKMKDLGIKPELEFYNPSNFYVMQDLIERGLLETPYLTQFVFGSQAASLPTPAHLLTLVNDLPAQSLFTVIGTGAFQLP